MNKKNDLLDNNVENNMKSDLKNNETNLNQEEDNYNINDEEKLTPGLYNKIASVVFNTLNNSVVRNIIKTNSNILKLLELQISNLFFLESELSKDLKENKYSRNFLQIISDVTEQELLINKSPKKNRTEILEDCNLLIVTIINSGKGIDREVLERIRTIDADSFKTLTTQISALDNFNSGNEATNQDLAGVELNSLNNQDQQINNNLNNNPSNLNKVNSLNSSLNPNINLNNLTNLGLLPQHPATNPNFYPYLSKPIAIPKLRKLLIGTLAISVIFILMTIIISFFVKGKIEINTTKGKQDFSLGQHNNWMLIIITLFIFVWSMYVFAKPMKLKREMYHTSLFVLVVLAIWIGFTVGYFFWSITDGYYQTLFQQLVDKDGTLDPTVVSQLKNLPNYQLFAIFSIITASVALVPILILVILILINPRLDRNKIMKANNEYQNAIAAAMNGKKYDIDPSLFDKEETNKHKQQKKQFSGRF